MAAYLLNEKRQAIIDIEKRQNVAIIVVPSVHLLTPQYEVERIRLSDMTDKDEKLASYKLAVKPEIASISPANLKHPEPSQRTTPIGEDLPPPPVATTPVTHAQQMEKDRNESNPGIIKKLMTFLFEKKEEKPTPTAPATSSYSTRPPERNRQPRRKGTGRHHQRHRRGERERHQGRGYNQNNYRSGEHRSREERAPREDKQIEKSAEHTQDKPSFSSQQEKPQPVQMVNSNIIDLPDLEATATPPALLTNEAVPSSSPETAAPGTVSSSGDAYGPSKKHKRFHPHRRQRQYGRRNKEQGEQTHRTLEGEDIYSTKKDEE
jgi:ribonuclease E